MSLSVELNLDIPFSDVKHETLLNIVHTANLLGQAGVALFRRFDLTEAQFNVLFALKFKQRDLTQSELGKRLVVTRASITSVLDKLEEKGLVERRVVPGNRRIFHVELTEKGWKMIREVEPLYRAEVHKALDDLRESDCRQLITYMERIRSRAAALRDEQ